MATAPCWRWPRPPGSPWSNRNDPASRLYARHRRIDRRRPGGGRERDPARRRRLRDHRRRSRGPGDPRRHALRRRRAAPLIVARDVDTRFVDAARVFGPQKGATAAQVAELTERLERLAAQYRDVFDRDVSALPGAGAAGGLAGGSPRSARSCAPASTWWPSGPAWPNRWRRPIWWSPARGASTTPAPWARPCWASSGWPPRPGRRQSSWPARSRRASPHRCGSSRWPTSSARRAGGTRWAACVPSSARLLAERR